MKVFFLTLFLLLSLHDTAQGDAGIIADLDHLPVITQEEAAFFPAPSGIVELTLDSLSLPYDTESNTYFIPQSDKTQLFDGEISLTEKENYTYYLLPDALCDKAEALQYSRGYTVYGTDGVSTDMSTVLFTNLPSLQITLSAENLPGEEDELCSIVYCEAANGMLAARQYTAEINLRGNTSKIFPKQSYRLQFVDSFGGNKHVSLAGLRTDDDWILNPMYTDSTKLREPVAYALWDLMNSSGAAAQSSRIRYVEVFFNGSYHGLYGLQERVDMKQVEGSKKADVLYKVRTNDRPTVEELLQATDRISVKAFEVENGDDFRGDTAALYRPAAAYMAAIDGKTLDENIFVSSANAIDYGLFVMLTQAHDSHFKNQFLNAVSLPGQTIMYKLPWDLNYTLGDVYRKDYPQINHTDYYIGKLTFDGYFETLLKEKNPAFILALQTRWQELRRTVLTEENLQQMLLPLNDHISAARARDHVRWPESGRSEGNTGSHEEILDFLSVMLARIDQWIIDPTVQEE